MIQLQALAELAFFGNLECSWSMLNLLLLPVCQKIVTGKIETSQKVVFCFLSIYFIVFTQLGKN